MKKIYLDYAAATPMDSRVLDVMQPYFKERFYNPSALYLDARSAANDIADARSRVAGWLGARPGEIIFTAGGTEANNLALFGTIIRQEKTHIVSTAIEHESVIKPLKYQKKHGWDYTLVKPKPDGQVNPDDIAKAVTDKTVLVSIIYANNEIGTIEPLKKISELLADLRKTREAKGNNTPLYFHTDACQAGNYLDLHVHRLGLDLMTLNGGKIYGPKQSGVLFKDASVKLDPIILGGGQEFGYRSGTENVPAIMGFAEALDIAQNSRSRESDRLKALQAIFIDQLKKKIPKVQINGSLKHRLPNNVHITIPDQDNERLVMALDEKGIQCASGSACSASKDDPSHVLRAIGLSSEASRSSLRFSMGRFTDEEAINYTVKTLEKLVA